MDELAKQSGAVGMLQALVWSRTKHGAKKKKVIPEGGTESELVSEVKAACAAQAATLMPAVPAAAEEQDVTGGEAEGEEEEELAEGEEIAEGNAVVQQDEGDEDGMEVAA